MLLNINITVEEAEDIHKIILHDLNNHTEREIVSTKAFSLDVMKNQINAYIEEHFMNN